MTTEERLSALESKLVWERWRARWALIFAGSALAMLLASYLPGLTREARAQGQAIPDEIRARRLVVVDGNGKTRALLQVDKDGVHLLLGDENGNTRVALTAKRDTPALALTDKNGLPRAVLGVNEDWPALFLYNASGKDFWSTPSR